MRPARDTTPCLVPALMLASPKALAAATLGADKRPLAFGPMDARVDFEMILAAERFWTARMRARERLGQGCLRSDAPERVGRRDVRRELRPFRVRLEAVWTGVNLLGFDGKVVFESCLPGGGARGGGRGRLRQGARGGDRAERKVSRRERRRRHDGGHPSYFIERKLAIGRRAP